MAVTEFSGSDGPKSLLEATISAASKQCCMNLDSQGEKPVFLLLPGTVSCIEELSYF